MTREQKMGARLVSIATALRLEADGAENYHMLTALADQVEIIADCLLDAAPTLEAPTGGWCDHCTSPRLCAREICVRGRSR